MTARRLITLADCRVVVAHIDTFAAEVQPAYAALPVSAQAALLRATHALSALRARLASGFALPPHRRARPHRARPARGQRHLALVPSIIP